RLGVRPDQRIVPAAEHGLRKRGRHALAQALGGRARRGRIVVDMDVVVPDDGGGRGLIGHRGSSSAGVGCHGFHRRAGAAGNGTMSKYLLVSFKTCPWVQRAAIALREKNISFEFRHIEPDNRPDWFLAISPHKKVPVLRVDDTVSLFESNAINEYL